VAWTLNREVGGQIPARTEFNSEVSVLSHSEYTDCALSLGSCDDETRNPPSYAEAKKMKSLTLPTCTHLVDGSFTQLFVPFLPFFSSVIVFVVFIN